MNERTIVILNPGIAFLFAIKEWWPHVTVAPLLSRTTVLNRGIPNGFTGIIPYGGQVSPTSMEGERTASKKAQKMLKKNINSLNKNNPKTNRKLSII